MSEFNIEGLDAVISQIREGSLAQMLALQLKGQIKRVEQLAAENLAMRETIKAVRGVADNSSGIAGWHLNGKIATWEEILPEIDDIETPATDAYLAGIKADGVEEFAAYCGEENSVFVEAKAYYRSLPDAAYEFCSMLREGADK